MTLIVFKPTGEARPPKKGELYKLDGEVRYAWEDGYISRSILTRHEIEATPDVLRALWMEEE